MSGLSRATEECKVLARALQRYEVTDTGPNGEYNMTGTLTKIKYDEAIFSLTRRLKENPEKRFLVIHCYSGHGLNENGR